MDINTIKNIIPVVSDNIFVQPYSQESYLLVQKNLGHYLKINKEVYNLLNLFDGKRTLEEVSMLFNKQSYTQINEDVIYNIFFKQLIKYGILENTIERASSQRKPDYLKLSFTIINKDILAKITPLFHFLFNKKAFLILNLICLLTITISLAINFDWLIFDLTLDSLVYMGFIMLFSSLFHELGHASAVTFYGIEQGGIGAGFYLLSPVYYTDVTDTWRLGKKERVIVNYGGVYFDLLFCTSLLICALLFSSKTLMLFSLILFFSSIYNLIPFLRSDGYWMLSDATDISNLYSKSNKQFFTFVKSIFNDGTFIRNRKNVFLVVYAFLNIILIGVFLSLSIFYNFKNIILFPCHLYDFLISIVTAQSINTYTGAQLLLPIFFYFLLYRFLKGIFMKGKIRE